MRTLAELQALADEQIREELMVRLLGWKREKIFKNVGAWDPFRDWNCTMQVVQRVQANRGIRISHLPYKGPHGASYVEYWSVWIEGAGEAVVHQSLQRAICLAALALSPSDQ